MALPSFSILVSNKLEVLHFSIEGFRFAPFHPEPRVCGWEYQPFWKHRICKLAILGRRNIFL